MRKSLYRLKMLKISSMSLMSAGLVGCVEAATGVSMSSGTKLGAEGLL